MKKRICIITLILFACTMLSTAVAAVDYNDIPEDSSCYEAVVSLSNTGVITGYGDGTFRPTASINRAEASAIIVRASGLTNDIAVPDSIYTDVANDFWGRKYIMLATEAGILDGIGNNLFSPDSDVTYNQIIKMIVCMTGKKELAESRGGWPRGYVRVAYENEIISTAEYSNMLYGRLGDSSAPRGDVARFVYKATVPPDEYKLTVGKNEYYIGMNASALSEPDEILQSANEFMWYIYGTTTYENFFAAGIADGTVVALAASGPGFEYNGVRAGDIAEKSKYLYTDQNADDTVHAVCILNNFYSTKSYLGNEALIGESRLNFHLTNGFRVQHGLSPLIWDDTAAEAALCHSDDMAANDYFAHNGLDGSNVSTRLTRLGVRWMQCGENIAAGTKNSGFVFYDGLVNSEGHRENLLGTYTYAGISSAFNSESTYKYYLTQNFWGN